MPCSRPDLAAFFIATVLLAGISQPQPARANQVYALTATSVIIDKPAPLFSTDTVSGTITLDDAVAPGMSFGASSVVGVLLDFSGITGTLADIVADIAPGPVQVFGTRSADGLSLSMLDFRFGFPATKPGCSFVCAGQVILNSGSDPSNFIALDDLAGATLSVIESFRPTLTLVPAPSGGLIFGLGLLALGAARGSGRTILRAIRPASARRTPTHRLTPSA